MSISLKDELSPEQFNTVKAFSPEKKREFATRYLQLKSKPKPVARKKKLTTRSMGDGLSDFTGGLEVSAGRIATGGFSLLSKAKDYATSLPTRGLSMAASALGADRATSFFDQRTKDTMQGGKDFRRDIGLGKANKYMNDLQEERGPMAKVGAVAGEIASYAIPGLGPLRAAKATKGLNTAGKITNFAKNRLAPELALDVGISAAYDETDEGGRNTLNAAKWSVAGTVASVTPFRKIFKSMKGSRGKSVEGLGELAKKLDAPEPPRGMMDKAKKIFYGSNSSGMKGPSGVQKAYQSAIDAMNSFSPKATKHMKNFAFSVKADEAKIVDGLSVGAEKFFAKYSDDVIQQVEDLMDGGITGKVSDLVQAAVSDYRRIADEAADLAIGRNVKKADGEYFQKRNNWTPKDYNVPTKGEKLEKFVQSMMKSAGITRDQAIANIDKMKAGKGNLGNYFGSLSFSREFDAPPQTRTLKERHMDYIKGFAKSVSKSTHLGDEVGPGTYKRFEDFLASGAIDRADRDYARDTMRAFINDGTSKHKLKMAAIRAKEPNPDAFFAKNPELLADNIFKASNSLGSMIMGLGASLPDMAIMPARSIADNAMRKNSVARMFTKEFLGDTARIELMAKRMGMFDSRTNLLRDGDIEILPGIMDAYFTVIGQKFATNNGIRVNIRTATARLKGLSGKKKYSRAETKELSDEFGLTDGMIKKLSEGKLDLLDLGAGVLNNTRQKVLGRGGEELVTASQGSAMLKNIYKFLRYPLSVVQSQSRAAKRRPGRTATVTGGLAFGIGKLAGGLEGMEPVTADILGVSEKDESRVGMMRKAKQLDEFLGTDDIEAFESLARGVALMTNVNALVTKVAGSDFQNPVQGIFTGLSINWRQAANLAKGVGGLADGNFDPEDRKNIAGVTGATRDANKYYEEYGD